MNTKIIVLVSMIVVLVAIFASIMITSNNKTFTFTDENDNSITFNNNRKLANYVSDKLKSEGMYIPGFRPGLRTTNYLLDPKNKTGYSPSNTWHFRVSVSSVKRHISNHQNLILNIKYDGNKLISLAMTTQVNPTTTNV